VSTIGEWLASLGMAEYTECFAEERIEIDVLSELTDQDLERLGIPLGHRREHAEGDPGAWSTASRCTSSRGSRFGRSTRLRRAPSAHSDVLRSRGLEWALGSARSGGPACHHRRLPPRWLECALSTPKTEVPARAGLALVETVAKLCSAPDWFEDTDRPCAASKLAP